MTKTQWWGLLISLLVIARTYSGVWMHKNRTVDDPSRAHRGWTALLILPLALVLGERWPNRGGLGRMVAIFFHWSVTAIFALGAFLMLQNDPL